MQYSALAIAALASFVSAQQFLDTEESTRTPTTRLTFGFPLVIDADSDGDHDVVLASNASGQAWLINDGHAFFADGTAAYAVPGADLRGALFADLDGDGDRDLLRPMSTSRVWSNDGTNHFTEVVGAMPPMSVGTSSTNTADFDGDGDLDVIIGTIVSPYVLRNDGGLSFTNVTAVALPAAADSYDNVVGDFDGDGDIDVVSHPGATQQIMMLHNDGGGVFTDVSATTIPVVLGNRLVTADFDGDLDLDLVAASSSGGIVLLENDGGGVFALGPALPALPNRAEDIRAVDIDGNGSLDLVMELGPSGTARWAVFTNQGGGVFTDTTAVALGSDPPRRSDWAIADLDGDQAPDLFLAPASNQRSRILVNDGTGVFTEVTYTRLEEGLASIGRLVDLDGDGDLDLARIPTTAGRKLYVNDGTGFFTDATAARAPAGASATGLTQDLEVIDLGDDGDADLLYAPGMLWENDGTGTFSDATAIKLPASIAGIGRKCVVFDADGDQDDDAVVWDQSIAGSTRLLLQSSGVLLELTAGRLAVTFDAFQVVPVDVEHDGDVDLVISSNSVTSPRARAFINDGTGAFTETAGRIPSVSSFTSSLVVDYDGDGDDDVLFGEAAIHLEILAFRNDRTSQMALVTGLCPGSFGSTLQTFAAADTDEDGDSDFVATTGGTTLAQFWINQGGAFVNQATTRIDRTSTGGVVGLAFGDVDRDGDADLFMGSNDGGDRVYVNRQRQLHGPRDAFVGEQLPFQFHSRPGYGTAAATGYLIVAFQLATAPIPTPFGDFLVNPLAHVVAGSWPIPAGTGVVDAALAVPPDPFLSGLPVHLQGVVVSFEGPWPDIDLTGRVFEPIR